MGIPTEGGQHYPKVFCIIGKKAANSRCAHTPWGSFQTSPNHPKVVLFFGGLTLFALGVIGEYLIRIVGTAESRPVYFVREIDRRED